MLYKLLPLMTMHCNILPLVVLGYNLLSLVVIIMGCQTMFTLDSVITQETYTF